MKQVVCFSASGNSLKIAQYLAQHLQWPLVDITAYQGRPEVSETVLDVVVIVFPIYGQTLNPVCWQYLKSIQARYFCLLFTYGKMNPGNVLKTASKHLHGSLMAAALIPTNHTYLEVGEFQDYPQLQPLLAKLNRHDFNPITVPALGQNPLRWVFPKLRSHYNVAMKVDLKKCLQCGICQSLCPMDAIQPPNINSSCLRCLRCYHHCPTQAITIRYRLGLRLYLKKKQHDQFYLYL